LARAFERPFLYAWDFSPHRGRKHGAPADGLGGDRFVVCIQNHDQVGNNARGDRLNTVLSAAAKQRLAAALLLLSPYLPLLFMGEEYGEDNPFPFFCSFGDPELARAVREGRKKELEPFLTSGEVPDPQAEATFAAAKLSWSWPEGSHRAGLRRLYRDLLSARREWPALRDFERRTARLVGEGGTGPLLELVRGDDRAGETIRAYFNLGDRPRPLPGVVLDGTSVLFRSEASAYAGDGGEAGFDRLRPFECLVLGPSSWKAYPAGME